MTGISLSVASPDTLADWKKDSGMRRTHPVSRLPRSPERPPLLSLEAAGGRAVCRWTCWLSVCVQPAVCRWTCWLSVCVQPAVCRWTCWLSVCVSSPPSAAGPAGYLCVQPAVCRWTCWLSVCVQPSRLGGGDVSGRRPAHARRLGRANPSSQTDCPGHVVLMSSIIRESPRISH